MSWKIRARLIGKFGISENTRTTTDSYSVNIPRDTGSGEVAEIHKWCLDNCETYHRVGSIIPIFIGDNPAWNVCFTSYDDALLFYLRFG